MKLKTKNKLTSFVLIDDLDVSPDFLDYFQALYPLLKVDKTLWCISAWNDNGIEQKIERRAGRQRKPRSLRFRLFSFEDLLHRSDFFPGLGWLLTKTTWNEIKANWPAALVNFSSKVMREMCEIQ